MNISWPILLLACGMLIAVVLILVLPIPRSQTRANTPASRRSTPVMFRDDDRYWYGGIFYNNPDDPDVFVPKRYGIGWTVNLGHPRGRLFMTALLLLPLVMLILTILIAGPTPIGCHPSGCHPFP
ncbi:MAG TPA: DUF5808 domain-containing protein [Ktedonobacteraceae bacterium]|nr:DUF5808 domain-containing protein [Ktedonobacteraceae bacterium]